MKTVTLPAATVRDLIAIATLAACRAQTYGQHGEAHTAWGAVVECHHALGQHTDACAAKDQQDASRRRILMPVKTPA